VGEPATHPRGLGGVGIPKRSGGAGSAHLNTGAILIAIYFRVLGRVQHNPEGTLPNHCILGGIQKAGTPEGMFRYRRMPVGRLSDRTPEGMLRYHYIQGDKLRDRQRALRLT
jgi:hypothetical protein